MANESGLAARLVRRKLGRGLGSLLSAPVQIEISPQPPGHALRPGRTPTQSISAPAHETLASQAPSAEQALAETPEAGPGVHLIPIVHLRANPRQPRRHFDDLALAALAESIKSAGVMQPIIVRPVDRSSGGQSGGPAYELVAGERRWRAAQRAGLTRIPAIIRALDDKTAAEFALVENLQREDLNPLERAEAFARLIDEFGLTHQDIAEQVGLERSSISNHLRLLELDGAAQEAVRCGVLSLGHAKALLSIANKEARSATAARAIREAWSVRELERRAREQAGSAAGVKSGGAIELKPVTAVGAHMADLERRLAAHLGTKVHLRPGRAKGAGKLVIEFYSLDQFEGLMGVMQFESE
jgi:ParB family chromosome partitioning protein